MQSTQWIKPGLYGAALGAIGLAIIGFSWGGWVTGGTATQMARSQATTEVLSALSAICMDQSRRDPQQAQKLAELKAIAMSRQADFVMTTGWATMPGQDEANREVARLCATKLGV